jgi:hypothetical protein
MAEPPGQARIHFLRICRKRLAPLTPQKTGKKRLDTGLEGAKYCGSYRKLLIIMNSGHLPVTSSAARSVRKNNKARKKPGRPRNGSNGHNGEHAMAAAGTLTRTKSLLLAALRVWELKQRIGE